MMIPPRLPSEETNPTLCCWFCSTGIIPVAVTQTRTGILMFCRGGKVGRGSRNQGLQIKPESSVLIKMPVQFPWNQQAFMGNQQQSSSIQGILTAWLLLESPPHPSALPSSCSLPSGGCGEIMAPSTGGRNLLNYALPIRGAGKYVRPSIYCIQPGHGQQLEKLETIWCKMLL